MNRVSLIIPTFNRPHLLPRAVESARRAGREVEVIVVDDASSDGTASVCAALCDIKYVRLDRNQGVAGARNVGLLASTGDFIAFLDDDDMRLPGSLDHQVSLLAAHPEAGFVAGGVMLADQDGVPTGEVAVPRAESGDLFWRVLELDVHLIPGSVVVRKECFFEVGVFNRGLSGIDDWDMWTRIAEVRPVLVDPTPVCVYRVASPASGQGSSALGRHLHAAVKHQARLFSLPRAQDAPARQRRDVRQSTRRRVADTLSWRAAEALPRGNFRFAASNFLIALRLSPLWAARPTHLRVLWRSASNATIGATQGSARIHRRPRLTEDFCTSICNFSKLMPKVSVIIASRNRCALMPRAIESARRASSDAEIVVVDDASEDQTREVCNDLSNIRYIRARRRLGISGARNVGVIASSSEYITFLDDDDVRLPHSIDAQVEALEARPEAGMIYGRVLYGDQECRPKRDSYPDRCSQGDLFWKLMSWNFIPCPTVVFRRACLLRVGLLDESAPGIDDWDLWIRIAELYPVLATEEPVAIWRQPTQTSGQFSFHAERMHRQARRLHRDSWLKLPRAVAAGAARRREAARDFAACASQQSVWEAASRLKAGRVFDSVRIALAGARMYPLCMSKKILSLSTLRSLRSVAQNYWRAERI